MKKTENKVLVEREAFEYNGKSYFSYFIKGQVRGREVRILLMPPDRGGYKVLDIVFDTADTAELQTKHYSMKDERTGKIIEGDTYFVQSVDENGEIYECQIKPFRPSDKALLSLIMR